MEPVLFGVLAASVVTVIILFIIGSRAARKRAESAARIEALQVLVAESSSVAPVQPLEIPLPVATQQLDFDDDWDLTLRDEDRVEDDREEMPPARLAPSPAARSRRPAPPVVAMPNQFVVTVPDKTRGGYHISFERTGSES